MKVGRIFLAVVIRAYLAVRDSVAKKIRFWREFWDEVEEGYLGPRNYPIDDLEIEIDLSELYVPVQMRTEPQEPEDPYRWN